MVSLPFFGPVQTPPFASALTSCPPCVSDLSIYLSNPNSVPLARQIRVFDFVVQQQNFFRSVPDSVRATFCHWGTILFDHESETATFDMVGCRWGLYCCVVKATEAFHEAQRVLLPSHMA